MPQASQAGYWLHRVAGELDVQRRGVIATPDIVGWDGWLSGLLTALVMRGRLSAPVMPTPLQALALWSRVLTQSGDLELTDPMAAAASVGRAFRLTQDYAVTAAALAQSDSALATWAADLRAACRERDCAVPAPLEAYLLDQPDWTLPAELQRPVTLIGLPPPSPLRAALIKRLRRAGMPIEWLPGTGKPAATAMLRCADRAQEAELAVAQARQGLRDGVAAVCIAAVDPQADAAVLSRVAAAVLDAGEATIQDQLPASRSNGLLGCADWLVECLGGAAPPGHWRMLLTSPFLGCAGGEAESGARLAQVVQRVRRADCDLEVLTEAWSADPGCAGQALPAALRAAQAALFGQERDALRSPGQWAAGIAAALRHVDWPHPDAVTELEWRQAEAVRDALSALASLDDILPPMTLRQAKDWWLHAAGDAMPPPLASAGRLSLMAVDALPLRRFERVIVLGAHAGRWLAPALPDPWLPAALQRRFRLPGFDPGRDSLRQRWRLGQWLAAAPEWQAICAQRQADVDLELPADLADWPSRMVDTPFGDAGEGAPAPLTGYADAQGLPLSAERRRRGGTALLREQAQCPFRAYARRRLAAVSIEAAAQGLDARARGDLAHEALAVFWTRVAHAAALRAMAADRLAEVIADAVAQALARRSAVMTAALRGIEQRRLERLLTAWLAMERERPDFEVLGSELPVTLSLGDLCLQGRVDRIDRVGDVQLLIDYKTTRGELSRDVWLGERPDEPQLPAYLIAAQPSAAADHGVGAGATDAAAQRSPVAIRADGVAFARVAGGRCEFVGLAVADDLIAGVKTPPAAFARSGDTRAWRQHRQLWATALQALADQFVQGAAAVAPKAGPTTCRWCDLHGLCRIGG